MPGKGRSAAARGYDALHRATRLRLLPLAYGRQCPLCGEVMLKGQDLDLDHSIPLILGGGGPSRIAHRYCNRSAGPRLRAALRRQTRLRNSQRW